MALVASAAASAAAVSSIPLTSFSPALLACVVAATATTATRLDMYAETNAGRDRGRETRKERLDDAHVRRRRRRVAPLVPPDDSAVAAPHATPSDRKSTESRRRLSAAAKVMLLYRMKTRGGGRREVIGLLRLRARHSCRNTDQCSLHGTADPMCYQHADSDRYWAAALTVTSTSAVDSICTVLSWLT